MIEITDALADFGLLQPSGVPAPLPPFPAAWTEEHIAVRVEDTREAQAAGRDPRVIASPVAPWDKCPHCRGTGYGVEGRNGYDYAVPCRCLDLRRWADGITAARFSADLRDATLDNWRPSPGWPAASSLRAYAAAWEPGAAGRLYCGAGGIGKSWLVATVARELIARPLPRRLSVRWVEWSALLDEMRDAFSTKRPESDIIGPLLSCDVLCVDELGKGQRTEWADAALERIVGKRLNSGWTVLATTNADEKDLPDVLGARVYSRLIGRCQVRTMVGPHRRALVTGDAA